MDALSFGVPVSESGLLPIGSVFLPISGVEFPGVVASSAQGLRALEYVEDRSIGVPDAAAPSSVKCSVPPVIFGVVDGIGGLQLASRIRARFHDVYSSVVQRRLTTPEPTADERLLAGGVEPGGVSDTMLRTLLHVDRELSRVAGSAGPADADVSSSCRETGAAAAFAWIGIDSSGTRCVHTAHLGAVGAVLGRAGKHVVLTALHATTVASEADGVRGRGGIVTTDDLVSQSGLKLPGLAVTRALGCAAWKPAVSGVPSCSRHAVDEATDFLIIASEALWARLGPAEAVAATYAYAQAHPSRLELRRAAQHLLRLAQSLGGSEALDACIVVVFLHDVAEAEAGPAALDAACTSHLAALAVLGPPDATPGQSPDTLDDGTAAATTRDGADAAPLAPAGSVDTIHVAAAADAVGSSEPESPEEVVRKEIEWARSCRADVRACDHVGCSVQ